MKKGLIALLIIMLIGAGALAVLRPWDDTSDDTNETSGNTTSQDNTSDNQSGSENTTDPAPMAVTVTYTDEGFSSRSYTVASGGTVTITNNSSDILQFSSDDHPEHTDNSELNADSLDPGQSTQLTVSRKGSWGVHNHENSLHEATIVVE